MSAIPSYAGRTEDDWMKAVANVTEIASEMKAAGVVNLAAGPEHFELGRALVDFADRIFAATAPPSPPP